MRLLSARLDGAGECLERRVDRQVRDVSSSVAELHVEDVPALLPTVGSSRLPAVSALG
jgi:hypothetical protein